MATIQEIGSTDHTALLQRAATHFLIGDARASRLALRDLVNASIGFEGLASEIGRPSKSLHRMLSDKGNPNMDNLSLVFSALGAALSTRLVVGLS